MFSSHHHHQSSFSITTIIPRFIAEMGMFVCFICLRDLLFVNLILISCLLSSSSHRPHHWWVENDGIERRQNLRAPTGRRGTTGEGRTEARTMPSSVLLSYSLLLNGYVGPDGTPTWLRNYLPNLDFYHAAHRLCDIALTSNNIGLLELIRDLDLNRGQYGVATVNIPHVRSRFIAKFVSIVGFLYLYILLLFFVKKLIYYYFL